MDTAVGMRGLCSANIPSGLCSQIAALSRPDGKAFCLKLPFVGVTREPFRWGGRASYRDDILHAHESQATVPFRNVMKCFRMLDIKVTVNQRPIHVLQPLTRHTSKN